MNETIITRVMRLDDVDQVAHMETICFPTPWSKQSFISEIEDNPCARYIVATQNDAIVGYGGMWMIIGEAHITNIAVRPDHRRKGIGQKILTAMMELCYEELAIKEMTLEVRVSNIPAQSLYEAFGFITEGRRKKYYEDNGEDALIMWCRDTTPYIKPILRHNMV